MHDVTCEYIKWHQIRLLQVLFIYFIQHLTNNAWCVRIIKTWTWLEVPGKNLVRQTRVSFIKNSSVTLLQKKYAKLRQVSIPPPSKCFSYKICNSSGLNGSALFELLPFLCCLNSLRLESTTSLEIVYLPLCCRMNVSHLGIYWCCHVYSWGILVQIHHRSTSLLS